MVKKRSVHKRYHCDPPPEEEEAWCCALFEQALRAALPVLSEGRSVTVLPRFRFLEYEEGQGMSVHVDGTVRHIYQPEKHSTHTFLFYLESIPAGKGGETDFMETVAAGNDAHVQASVRPERNALLLFCARAAHVGREVQPGWPKVVLRGDV